MLAASPSAALTYTWKLATPATVVAYQVDKGVITIASASLVGCDMTELVPEATPFVYDFKVGWPKGVLCMAKQGAPIAAYYQAGSPSTVTVNTNGGPITVTVRPPPPAQPNIGHLPFH